MNEFKKNLWNFDLSQSEPKVVKLGLISLIFLFASNWSIECQWTTKRRDRLRTE